MWAKLYQYKTNHITAYTFQRASVVSSTEIRAFPTSSFLETKKIAFRIRFAHSHVSQDKTENNRIYHQAMTTTYCPAFSTVALVCLTRLFAFLST